MSVIARESLAAELAMKESISVTKANQLLKTTFDLISEHLSAGNNVRLTGIGTLRQATLSARTYRNPRTGAVSPKGERRAIRFEASTKLEQAIGR